MKLKTLALSATAALALIAGSADATTRLRLANSLSEDHPTSTALQQFADEVEEKPTVKSPFGFSSMAFLALNAKCWNSCRTAPST